MPDTEKPVQTLKLWEETWKQLLSGNLINYAVNDRFEMLTKLLWSSPNKNLIKKEILHTLPHIFKAFATKDHPPPILLTLISLKDNDLNLTIQELAILDWIKNGASEPTTFQLLNLKDTLERNGVVTKNFIISVIKYMNEEMDAEMLKALGFMLTEDNNEYLITILKKFAGFTRKSILKEFTQMVGRKAVLGLMNFMRPGDVQKILK